MLTRRLLDHPQLDSWDFSMSGVRSDYMHEYEDTLEKAEVAIARELGGTLVVRPGAVNS